MLRGKTIVKKVKKFEFDDSVAPSDCAFKANGNTLEELFGQAALAVTACMVETSTVQTARKLTVDLSADTLEDLLYDWLSEIVYLKDTESLFLTEFEIDIKTEGEFRLTARAAGGSIDYESQQISVDVKAVTMYKFSLKQIDSGWEAFVVLDI